MLDEIKGNITQQIMDLINELTKDATENLSQLNKTIWKINDQVNKELEDMKMYQTEIQAIKTPIQSISTTSNKCEDSFRTKK